MFHEHDGDAPDGGVAVPRLLFGLQDEPQVGENVGAQDSLFSCAQSAVTHNSVAGVNWAVVIACHGQPVDIFLFSHT